MEETHPQTGEPAELVEAKISQVQGANRVQTDTTTSSPQREIQANLTQQKRIGLIIPQRKEIGTRPETWSPQEKMKAQVQENTMRMRNQGQNQGAPARLLQEKIVRQTSPPRVVSQPP
jgi:hypothetical protein